jgi:hypothetical protein
MHGQAVLPHRSYIRRHGLGLGLDWFRVRLRFGFRVFHRQLKRFHNDGSERFSDIHGALLRRWRDNSYP